MSWPEGLPSTGLRLGTMLRARVHDSDGKQLGRVHDVVARRTGPVLNEAAGQAMVVDRLVVGPGGMLGRLGRSSRRHSAPAVLRRLTSDAYEVPWAEVASCSGGRLHLTVTAAALDARRP